ncbi:AAA family ATPase [Paenibacillus sp. MBLB4367]|uniref:AAA family ATPase n=1 Tax=Paenibacillus sp. MBLB4367 TaxID=3384767 RepID=UPI00390820A9
MERNWPLFIVTGSSGSGKTYVLDELRKIMPGFVAFDLDNLRGFIDYNDWQKGLNIYVRFARDIVKSGVMTILCGTVMPWDMEKCADFECFSHVYYLNLHCDDDAREQRLRARDWPENKIHDYKNFAKWLIDNADTAYSPPMPIVDTTNSNVTEVASRIKEWVLQYA